VSNPRPVLLWEGRRADDVARVGKLVKEGGCGEAGLAWNKFMRFYYRRYNDGDKPHHAAYKYCARVAGITLARYWDCAMVGTMENIGDALIDQILQAARDTRTINGHPLYVLHNGKRHGVPHVARAAHLWERYRDRYGFGASVASGWPVIDSITRRTVARVSYNGRLWNPDGTVWDVSKRNQESC